MPVLCRPAIWVPPNIISMDETLALCRRLHAEHEQLPLALRMIKSTGVAKRHLVQPVARTLRHPGFEARNHIYARAARDHIPGVVDQALSWAGLRPDEIDAIVFVSCTGFTMPPLTAWMINSLGFRNDTRQIPIAQLGCAAGGSAINRAHDFCIAYPGANVLIVACELCSLCYQPTDSDVGSLLSAGLFGDAIGAAVVRSAGGTGMSLARNASQLIPDTLDWIAYEVKATGFHFRLDKRVPGTMSMVAPVLRMLAEAHGWNASRLDFYVIHAGGPRILDDLSHYLNVPPAAFRHSRATLTDYGNIASVAVLDALRRHFDQGLPDGARGLLSGFGPGITAEATVGSWTTGDQIAQPSARDRKRGTRDSDDRGTDDLVPRRRPHRQPPRVRSNAPDRTRNVGSA